MVLEGQDGDLVPRAGQALELRFFGGRSVAETVDVQKVSKKTVMLRWKPGQGWLRRELRQEEASGA